MKLSLWRSSLEVCPRAASSKFSQPLPNGDASPPPRRDQAHISGPEGSELHFGSVEGSHRRERVVAGVRAVAGVAPPHGFAFQLRLVALPRAVSIRGFYLWRRDQPG